MEGQMSDKRALTRLAKKLLFEFNDKDVVDKFTLYDRPGPKINNAESSPEAGFESTIGREVPLKPSVLMSTQNFAERPPVEDDEYLPSNRPELSNAASVISSMIPPDQIEFFYNGLHDLYDAALNREGSIDDEEHEGDNAPKEDTVKRLDNKTNTGLKGESVKMPSSQRKPSVKKESDIALLLRKLILEVNKEESTGSSAGEMSDEDAIAFLKSLNKRQTVRKAPDYGYLSPDPSGSSKILQKLGYGISPEEISQGLGKATPPTVAGRKISKPAEPVEPGVKPRPKGSYKPPGGPARISDQDTSEKKYADAILAKIFGYSTESGVRQWALKVQNAFNKTLGHFDSTRGKLSTTKPSGVIADENFDKLIRAVGLNIVKFKPAVFESLISKYEEVILSSANKGEIFPLADDAPPGEKKLDKQVQNLTPASIEAYMKVFLVVNDPLIRTLIGQTLGKVRDQVSKSIEEKIRLNIQNIDINGRALSSLVDAKSLRSLEDTMFNQVTGGSSPDFENIKKRISALSTAAGKLGDAEAKNILEALDKLFQKGTFADIRHDLGLTVRQEGVDLVFKGSDIFRSALQAVTFEEDESKEASKAIDKSLKDAEKGVEEYKDTERQYTQVRQDIAGSSAPGPISEPYVSPEGPRGYYDAYTRAAEKADKRRLATAATTQRRNANLSPPRKAARGDAFKDIAATLPADEESLPDVNTTNPPPVDRVTPVRRKVKESFSRRQSSNSVSDVDRIFNIVVSKLFELRK
jgi:hypothetical protein